MVRAQRRETRGKRLRWPRADLKRETDLAQAFGATSRDHYDGADAEVRQAARPRFASRALQPGPGGLAARSRGDCRGGGDDRTEPGQPGRGRGTACST